MGARWLCPRGPVLVRAYGVVLSFDAALLFRGRRCVLVDGRSVTVTGVRRTMVVLVTADTAMGSHRVVIGRHVHRCRSLKIIGEGWHRKSERLSPETL